MPKSFENPKRVLLKLSWEALEWKWEYGIDGAFVTQLAKKIVYLTKHQHIQIVIVIGWWNIFRWVSWAASGIDRSSADYMWMLATIMNGIALWDAIEKQWQDVRICSALEIPRVAELFIRRRVLNHLAEWRVAVCVAWTWNPYFTTDSSAVLRALELNCDFMVKWTKVDWVYDKDPAKHSDAKRYEEISLDDALKQWLRVMDQSAIAMANDEGMPIFVCRIEDIDKIGSPEMTWTYVVAQKIAK